MSSLEEVTKVNGATMGSHSQQQQQQQQQTQQGGQIKAERSMNNLIDGFLSGTTALSTVQSAARVMGSGSTTDNGEGVDEYYNKILGDNSDGRKTRTGDGAFGIADVFSGRGLANRRSKLIQFQRLNLRNNGWSEMPLTEEEEGRMTPLVKALPSSQKAAEKKKNGNEGEENSTKITTALATLEKDMAILDNLASLQPQLSGTEVSLLLGAVVASGMGPIFFPGTSVTELLAPAAAACE